MVKIASFLPHEVNPSTKPCPVEGFLLGIHWICDVSKWLVAGIVYEVYCWEVATLFHYKWIWRWLRHRKILIPKAEKIHTWSRCIDFLVGIRRIPKWLWLFQQDAPKCSLEHLFALSTGSGWGLLAIHRWLATSNQQGACSLIPACSAWRFYQWKSSWLVLGGSSYQVNGLQPWL